MSKKNDDFVVEDLELEDDIDLSNDDELTDELTDDLTEELSEKKDKGENDSFFINKESKKKDVDLDSQIRRDDSSSTAPRTIVIDFLDGTSKKSEAMAYARGFIDNHYPSPDSCSVYLLSYEGSYAIEIQDGGNRRPYLPNVIKTLEEDPEACVCIQNKRRTLEIKRDIKGVFSAVLLPEGIDSTETNIVRVSPSETAKMRPYSINALLFGVIGLSLCLFAFIFLLLTSFACLLSYKRPVKALPVTKMKNLPILQWKNIIDKYDEEMYVEKITYLNNRWKIAQRKIPLVGIDEYTGDVDSEYVLTEQEQKIIKNQLKEEILRTIRDSKNSIVNKIKESVKKEIKEEIKEEAVEEEVKKEIKEEISTSKKARSSALEEAMEKEKLRKQQ